jgi:hypothetical protein
MIENELDIQALSTKRTDFQTDRVLPFGQVTEKKEKANPSHFLNFHLASRTNGTFGFARHTKPTLRQNQKSHFLANAPITTINLTRITC